MPPPASACGIRGRCSGTGCLLAAAPWRQPNITSQGAGVLTARFWLLVVLTGAAAGLFRALLMLILVNVQYAAFGYHWDPAARC
jgi:hypothetical protein